MALSDDTARRDPWRRPPGRTVPPAFYDRDARDVARELLGLLLCRRGRDGRYVGGRIVETEAYVGEDDPASHAAAGLTPRTRTMYGPPGHAYVYFTYGMHHCLNAVTGPGGFPAAVLIRALRPVAGTSLMARRRGTRADRSLASGPARLCQALAVDLRLDAAPLWGPELIIRDDRRRPGRVESGPRIGIRVGTEHPWRYWVSGDPHVSRPPGGARGSRVSAALTA